MERKNAWEKYPEGKKKRRGISVCRGLQKIYF